MMRRLNLYEVREEELDNGKVIEVTQPVVQEAERREMLTISTICSYVAKSNYVPVCEGR